MAEPAEPGAGAPSEAVPSEPPAAVPRPDVPAVESLAVDAPAVDAAGHDTRAGHGTPHGTAARQARSSMPSLAAGFMLVAGILHLYLVDVHMAHARGVGIFFLGVGIAQTIWAILYLRYPNATLGRLGIAALVVAPTVLYIVTRVVRAPWSGTPEPVDLIGVTTQAAQLLAGAALWAQAHPSPPRLGIARAVAVGALLAVASYGGAIASEDVEWLAEPELAHGHDGGLHAEGGDHAHGGGFTGTRGENIVGTVAYYGPATGNAIDQHCRAIDQSNQDCWLFYLQHHLTAFGSVPAFDLLVDLMEANPSADAISHPLAHVLGHHAYQVYGLDIDLTLAECSYDVFQGCIHGALQAYFTDLASQGRPIDGAAIGRACDYADTRFETYTCLHGVGHGVMMYNGYELHDSLDLCAELTTSFDRSSCYGGVVMENVVAYLDSLKPGWEPHDHGSGPPQFWVDPDEPAYPCNEVHDRYGSACWRMQTSLILHFNKGNFEATAQVCDEDAGKFRDDCYASLGRDAVPYAREDPHRMMQNCMYGDDDMRQVCMRAVTSGVILQHNTPYRGLELCPQFTEEYHHTCYKETGRQATSMLGETASADVCAEVPADHREACEAGRAR